jgi:hypothetical protein
MLTIDDIKNKVNTFSPGKSVEELIDEIIVMYKVEKGLKDIDNGDISDWEDFKVEMRSWSKSA